ncbi:MAG: hypothetical protein CVU44_21905 [Chloroflexi bacterium HGW-Chloroflexi-6]|nr:MAG: hypothetical protein CVU44_21905 [Chloroflexi bacterium HGW-Chloroflexi-6]
MNPIFAFLRFFFHHLYHGLAWMYDLVAATVSLGRWRDWGRATIPHLRGTRILELGFGPGHLQRALTETGFQTFGLDESEQMCRQAANNLRKNNIFPALSRGYAQTLPFADATFDSLVATFPSEYIFAPQTLSEAERVLKDGGRLIVALSAWPGGTNLAERSAAWLFRITGQGGSITAEVETQIKARFTAGRLKTELVRAQVRQSTVYLIVAEKLASPHASGSVV